MNFWVGKEKDDGWELKINFNPRLELKVGYGENDNLDWELYFKDPKNDKKKCFDVYQTYGSVDEKLFPDKPGKDKYVYVYLDTWGDPNVGWG